MPRTANALDLLRRDHRHVLTLFKQVEKTEDEQEQRQLCDEIIEALSLHTEIEESVFYPFLRDATDREDLYEEASLEHHAAEDLLGQLRAEAPGTPRFHAIVKVRSFPRAPSAPSGSTAPTKNRTTTARPWPPAIPRSFVGGPKRAGGGRRPPREPIRVARACCGSISPTTTRGCRRCPGTIGCARSRSATWCSSTRRR